MIRSGIADRLRRSDEGWTGPGAAALGHLRAARVPADVGRQCRLCESDRLRVAVRCGQASTGACSASAACDPGAAGHHRAGRYSDNTAARILVRYLGGAVALNAYAKSIGMTASVLWVPNTTTPDDLTAAWVNAALDRLGGAAARQWLFPLLTHTVNEHGIPAGLPASATVVHKVGTLDGTENDSGYIVSVRTSYVLSIAVDGVDETLGWSLIAQISARIWQYESGRPDFVTSVAATPVAPSPRLNRH